MSFPTDHPLRMALSDEVHARPPELLVGHLRISYLAMASDIANRDDELGHLGKLARQFGARQPEPGTDHYSMDFGPFRLKWERHTEFTRYVIIVPASGDEIFTEMATDAVPAHWLKDIPGEVLVATHAELVPGAKRHGDPASIAWDHFAGNALVGAQAADGRALALTDARIHADGFGRLIVFDSGLEPRQAGRTIQRLPEIDTYRTMALLALPVARRLGPFLAEWDKELAQITERLAGGVDHDEQELLDRLTRLEAQIDSREASDHFRFGAAEAYYGLVLQRIADLRESRIEGLQTFLEFTQRRASPAMSTCLSVASRLRGLSERVSRATQLLSTRIDIARQTQNQAVLESMDRRAALQLRLEETVEGLSVAAVTYYIVGLVGYGAKALKASGLKVDPDLAIGISIPVVLTLTAIGIHRIRRHIPKKRE